MNLKRLEIQGFKSFADYLKLDINKGITAVVGPNGSGKSNIADSVRWVLGEQSPKTLRGAKMEDVIFSGTQNRKPLGFAEVSITLDNSDGKIPISYGEVTVTRRVYRSGESEYFINRTSCRLKDIHELFMDTGVGKEGYSIIGQGQIDRVLSTKPEDRRFLFEEAVGIVKYKSRKQEAEKKLELEKQNLIRVRDIILELEKQIEPLSIQAERAKQYLDIKEKLKEVELNLFIQEADLLKEELSSLEGSFSINKEELNKQKEVQTKQKEECTCLKRALEEIENKIFQTQNEILELRTSIEKTGGSNKVIQQQIEHCLLNVKRLQDECSKVDSKKRVVEDEKTQAAVKSRGLSLNLKAKKALLEEKENNFYEITHLLTSNETKIEDFKSDIIEKMNESSEIKTIIQKLTGSIEQLDNRKEQIKTEKAKNQTQYKESQIHLKALHKLQQDQELQKQKSEEQINKLTDMNHHLAHKINGETINLNNLTEKMHRYKSRQQVLNQMKKEYEGFNKSVKSILKLKQNNPKAWGGICGVVAELIQVPRGYETAIEVALGSSMQNIVTTTEEATKDAIEYLKKNQLGRATFLPHSAIRARELGNEKDSLLKEKGILGIASTLVTYDSFYNNIISYLLGRVLVVTNLDYGIALAKKYKHRYKIVTLEGDILNTGGSMTGGSIYQKSSNIFARNRELIELSHELNKLIEAIKETQRHLEDHKHLRDLNISKIEKEKEKLQEINMGLLSKTHEIKQCKELINQLEDKEKQLLIEMEQLGIQHKETSLTLIEKSNQLKEMDNEIEKIHSRIESHQLNLQEEKISKDALAEEITKLRIEISSLQQDTNHIYQDIERLEKEITTLTLEKEQREKEIKTYKEQKEEKKKEIQKNKEEIKTLDLTLEKKLEEQVSLQEAKKSKATKLDVYEGAMDKTTENVELLTQEINRIENKKIKLKLEQENLYNTIWEEYEQTYHSALKFKTDMGTVSTMKKQSIEYKNLIKGLGNINLDAISENQKVKERYQFLSEQKQDILSAEQKLYSIIKELTTSMEKQFTQNFATISDNFNEVFKELFGGGKGYLQLTDEENVLESGIEIIAQPPGKKLQNMMLLSGGEKALTAIALLFSILKMKPSPFCILDEIEAALDDANVNRFAGYLSKFDKDAQFIVITHRKGTMEAADTLYGVTMQEQGISKLLSVKLSDLQENEEAS
ncbi:MAG: chromosome segregation protein SMC [Epulopiscium sp.]|nr:chromosome segregation protein SMC [Candidatus Epulonipiscium sp.]